MYKLTEARHGLAASQAGAMAQYTCRAANPPPLLVIGHLSAALMAPCRREPNAARHALSV